MSPILTGFWKGYNISLAEEEGGEESLNGTTVWSNYLSCTNGGFSGSPTLAFNGLATNPPVYSANRSLGDPNGTIMSFKPTGGLNYSSKVEVYTYTSGTGKIYTNGVVDATASYTSNHDLTQFHLGSGGVAGGLDDRGMWNGEIGPVHVYNRELTAAEVLQNFNAQRGRFGV